MSLNSATLTTNKIDQPYKGNQVQPRRPRRTKGNPTQSRHPDFGITTLQADPVDPVTRDPTVRGKKKQKKKTTKTVKM